MEWLKSINGVKKLILTHGDDHSRIGFKEKVISELGLNDVILPTLGEEITL
jgi:Cft2 family RNA processing exonuclease